ncbi:serine hydrolase [Demequina sp. NBRC 110057]|uniref:serine hydrolase domain-containing protein n=1 Tax=Demequina sp. NBRC 110057 TaxID=1570346 RepID=UPI000A059964|nr:serine hydrolase domain-containing protein [Demequina sp. NBRC 110057]
MDAALDTLHSLLPRRHRIVLLAVAAGGRSASRAVGCEEAADAEIGSVSKGLTGMLYSDALARGEVRADSRLGEFLDLGDGPAAGVTLGALAAHRSGLPRLGPAVEGPSLLSRTWAMWRRGENPYGESVDGLLAQAREAAVGKERFEYSNLGFALLGHAVAARLGLPYGEALRLRVLEPLGMRGAYTAGSVEALREGALRGVSKRGLPHDPWVGEGIAPAGGVRATAADLEALVAALAAVGTADAGIVPGGLPVDPLDAPPGAAPWVGALVPREPVKKRAMPGTRIGHAWMTSAVRGRQVTWHNGQTGGFASFVGVDRAAGVAVGVVSACASGVDHPGFVMLERLRAEVS